MRRSLLSARLAGGLGKVQTRAQAARSTLIRGVMLERGMIAPEKVGAGEERMVDGAAERLPTEGGVGGIKVGQEICGIKGCADARVVVAAGVGSAEIDIGRFAEVAIEAKMADNAGILAAVGGE